MITVDYGTLRSDPFKASLSKLVNSTELEPKTAYRVMRLAKDIETKLRETQVEWVKLLGKYVKTEGTQWKLNEDKTDFDYLDGVDKDAAKKEIMGFLTKTAEIGRDKIGLDTLYAAKLSPVDLSTLEPIISTDAEV
jgi:hypothetical protein